MTDLRTSIEQLLAPAIDVRAPYAKQLVDALTALADMRSMTAAYHALQSYAHGNGSPVLAQSIVAELERTWQAGRPPAFPDPDVLVLLLASAVHAQHHALDHCLAMLATRDRSFMPSKSAVWPAVLVGQRAIATARAAGVQLPEPGNRGACGS